MNPASNNAAWLERERRLMFPAGIVTLLGVTLFIVSVLIQAGTGAAEVDTDLELLDQYREHGSTLLLGDILGGLGFLCFSFPLYVFFKAAEARAPRVRAALVAFAFIGPVLLAIQGPLQTIALKDASDQFSDQPPAREASPATGDEAAAGSGQAAQPEAAGDAAAGAKPQDGGEGEAGEVTAVPSTDETSTTTTTDQDEEEDEDTAEENRAEDVISDSSLVQFSRALIFPGLLGLVFALIYIPMWSMRTGLITRFWGSLGMALGVSLVLLPFAQLAVVLWFTAMAMLLLGRWPGGRPPAWEAGVAIPWLKPGQKPPDDPDDPVEGRGREIPPDAPGDDGEPPEGSNGIGPAGEGSDPRSGGDPGSGGPELPPGPTEPPPRKRKRRG